MSLGAEVRLCVAWWPFLSYPVAPDGWCAAGASEESRQEPVCLSPPVLKDRDHLAWACMPSISVFWMRMS